MIEPFNLQQAVKEIQEKYDNRLLGNPVNLQKIIKFEYNIELELKELEKLYQRDEDYEKESRIIEYGRN